MTTITAYHGTATPRKITKFKAGVSSYIYFSNLESIAANYADADADRRASDGLAYQERVITSLVTINNPFEFDAEMGGIDFLDHADIFEDAEADGFDGAIIYNPIIGGEKTGGVFIIPFNTKQIKIINQ